jgi:DMSO/TMAO reductase YedYZ molybdopterin-dependent catalytic subunit
MRDLLSHGPVAPGGDPPDPDAVAGTGVVRGPDEESSGQAAASRRITRRAALSLGGAVAGAAAVGRVAPALAGHEPRQPTPDRPPPSADLVSYEETILAFRCHGAHLELIDKPITPLGSHYLLIHFDIPQLTDANYAITIGGRVNKPLTLTLEDLKKRPAVKQAVLLECAGTGRSYAHPRAIYVPWFSEAIGVYEYTGTPLRPILEEAGLLDDAEQVVFTGHDSGIDLGTKHAFERALPVDEALKDGVMLAWEANGQPLLPAHGFPLRLLVPTWYGMASVKWLKKITVIDHTFQGVEQKQVYRLQTTSSDSGRPVQEKWVNSRIRPPGYPDAISRMRFVNTGPQQLVGKAWSGFAPIVKVEVSTDDRRTWSPATLGPPVSPYSWTPFAFTWNATQKGQTILSSRATDADGNVQPLRPWWNVQGMAQNGVERIGVEVI